MGPPGSLVGESGIRWGGGNGGVGALHALGFGICEVGERVRVVLIGLREGKVGVQAGWEADDG